LNPLLAVAYVILAFEGYLNLAYFCDRNTEDAPTWDPKTFSIDWGALLYWIARYRKIWEFAR
jgi:hypothetical protein